VETNCCRGISVEEGIMVKWLRKLFKNERGQALAEYQVLFPGSILMILATFSLVAKPVAGMYCEAVSMFSNGVCEDYLGEGAGETEDLEETETPEPTPTEICVILTEEEGCSQCDQGDCACLPGVNEGSFTGSNPIGSLVIKAGREYHVYWSGLTEDGCYDVSISGNQASWTKVGNGSGCKDVSHLESWYTPICVME
jgi:Flp pilus assembly pilin Flp